MRLRVASMSKKKQNKPHSHYCHVCGQHKANEKFSGKGHAAHICKSCSSLSPAERAAMITVRKIEDMAFRQLNEAEIKWLRKHLNDPRPEIRESALSVHRHKFPHYERNADKKGLIIHSLELYIHADVWDEYGDEIPVHARIFANRDGALRLIDYSLPENDQEKAVTIPKHIAQKLLKAFIHELNTPFWDTDLSDSEAGSSDPFLDILPEYYDFDADLEDESDCDSGKAPNEKEPVCYLKLELNAGKIKEITFYNQLHEEPQSMFWTLMDFFNPIELDEE